MSINRTINILMSLASQSVVSKSRGSSAPDTQGQDLKVKNPFTRQKPGDH